MLDLFLGGKDREGGWGGGEGETFHFLPGDVVKFCTAGVVLPGLLLPAGLQAPSGVAGVVVLGLSTGLLPEDSLQYLGLRPQTSDSEKH